MEFKRLYEVTLLVAAVVLSAAFISAVIRTLAA
jgi:hypothetical protein